MDLGSGSYNGLAFGPGTKFHVSALAGIDDLPGVRTSDQDKAGDHGQFVGRMLLGKRVVNLGITCIGSNRADYNALLEQARAAFVPPADGITELPLLLFGNARRIGCRVSSRKAPYDATRLLTYFDVLMMLEASDPRMYAATLQSATVSLPTSSGGLAWPATWPISWGASSGGGTFVAHNAGNWATRPVLTITGPIDNPTVENITSGGKLTFILSLGVSDTLTVDLLNKTVLLNGTASRRSTMTADSAWWEVAPDAQTPGGAGSTISFHANTVQVGSQLTMNWRDAFI